MRCYGAARLTAAGTNLLPGGSLYAIASRPLYVVEVAVWNTTTTATAVALQRLTTAGTSTAETAIAEDSEITPVGTPRNVHSSTGPTITTGFIRKAVLGAAAGSGIIWTFGGKGVRIPAGTANGLGLTVPTGTGQVWDFEFVWDE